MCWSKFEREEWERAQREREAERLVEISASEPKVEKLEAPEAETAEREDELVRV